MTIGGHIRLAGAVTVIVAFFMKNISLHVVGLIIIAYGATVQIDSLERRIAKLEPKETEDEG